MSSEFFGGRKWIAAVSLAAAMAATGIYGATTGKLPSEALARRRFTDGIR